MWRTALCGTLIVTAVATVGFALASPAFAGSGDPGTDTAGCVVLHHTSHASLTCANDTWTSASTTGAGTPGAGGN